ncbi:unnamed protein product [Rhizoctonia solani]|uniref:NmrA-like domain-containing protein n=1 Tax=Rhizoctonia solani TaxID=456999 RepID=A0A8H3DRU2_9AGAM|nr:unnamed protein product [Rhizoctonia solani]
MNACAACGVKLFFPSEFALVGLSTGEEKNAWTTVEDVARFVPYILQNVPVEQLKNQKLRIEGDRKSFNEFVSIWERKHRVKLDVKYRPISELHKRISQDPSDHEAAIGREMFSGRAAEGPISSSLFLGWNPKSLEKAI